MVRAAENSWGLPQRMICEELHEGPEWDLSGTYEGPTPQPPHLETSINTGILRDYEGLWG